MIADKDLLVDTLGAPEITSPIYERNKNSASAYRMIEADEKVRFRVEIISSNSDEDNLYFEKAGPREKIYFDPKKTTAAIVTCGGLCPGLNNVIRSLVYELSINYGVENILGFRYGYLGFEPNAAHKPMKLTCEDVKQINFQGGSILGSSRGPVDPKVIVDTLLKYKVNILFTVGGDGTQRGALKITDELNKRNAKVSLIGIPKTIDNDVPFVYRTFGFATAVEQAQKVIENAGVEADSYLNCVSIVRLMGRDAGFIAAMATLAAQQVDVCLIPEASFTLEGENGLYNYLLRRLKEKGSCIVVVAEGAGQEFFTNTAAQFDGSGNKLHNDIGVLLKDKLSSFCKEQGIAANFRYFDPTYSVRSVPANVADNYFSDQLARAAAHAGMQGKTNIIIGDWYNNLTHVPIPLVCAHKKRINPKQELWRNVLAVTGQPTDMK
ncbi:MAG: ATP-dependent 6-phosphofructokinase [Deltaproteobacteria bacterium]|nr:ATP-dependent 6-phosphofructokinase [Deltaproteobacteria bacterium]